MSSLHQILQEGLHFHQKGMLPQAEQRYRRIISVQPNHGWAHHFLGAIAQEFGHHEDAYGHFQQATQSIPHNAAAWNGMGRSLFALGRYEEALVVQKHAVMLDAKQANFFNNLGNTHYALSKFDDAKDVFVRATQLNPDLLEAWCNLGRTALAQSQYMEAKDYLEHALSIQSLHWESWTNLGMVWEGLGDMKKAGLAYHKAVEIHPHNAQSCFNLGQWFHKKKEWFDAKRLYRQALEHDRNHIQSYLQLARTVVEIDDKIQVLVDGVRSNPTSLSISLSLIQLYLSIETPRKAEQVCLAIMQHHQKDMTLRTEYVRVLVDLNRWEDAQQEIDQIEEKSNLLYVCMLAVCRGKGNTEQAIEIAKEGLLRHKNSVELYNSFGVLLAEKGDFVQAKWAYEEALQLDPNNSAIQRHLSLIQGMNDDERVHLKSIFHDLEVNREERVHAGFALANVLDKTRQYNEAAAVLYESNTLHRMGLSYSVYWSGIHMSKVQEHDQLLSLDPLDVQKKGPRPIFIVGLPRSGSTLTEQILSTHSRVEGIGEISDLFDSIEKYGPYPECLLQLSTEDLYDIRTTYLQKIAQRSQASVIVDKFLNNIWLVGLIRLIFPDAPILLMQRNALDNGLSMFQKLFTQGHLYCYDLEELGIYMNYHQRLVEYWSATKDIHIVNYEHLVHEPKEQIQKLVDVCGLHFEDSLLRFYETKRSVRTASLFQVRQPISTGSVEKWKKYEAMLLPLREALVEKRMVPKNRDAAAELINMGVAFAQSEIHQHAQELYEHAAILNPDHPQLWGNWLYSVIAQGKIEEAKNRLEKLPNNAQMWFYRGVVAENEEKREEAKRCYVQALCADEHYIDARFNLALLYVGEQKYVEGTEHYLQILETDPKHIEAQLGLGGISIVQKNYTRALEYYQHVFSRDDIVLQGSSQLWPHVLEWAILCRLEGLYTKSESILDDLIALNPQNTKAWYQKGILYEEIGALEKSQNHFLKALEFARQNHAIHSSLGTLYKRMGEYAKAEHHFTIALSLEPSKTSAHNNLGNLYNTMGEFEKSQRCYRRAIEEVPSFYDAYRHLAQVKKFCNTDDADLLMMIKALKNAQEEPANVMQLSFALGKVYDDLGMSQEAFSYLLRGNALKRSTFSFSMRTEDQKCDALMSYFDSPNSATGHASDQPIFIVGMPRSGTSLCEQILASHSHVFGGGELNAMGMVRQQVHRSTNLGFPLGLDEFHEEEFSALGELYLQKLNAVGQGRYITDKLPNNFLMIGFIKKILPNAKIIYCRRDPRDNGLSLFLRYFVGFQGFAYSLEEIGSYLVMHHRLMTHWLTMFGESIFVLDYEKMVSNQEEVTQKIISYCGLSYEPSMAEFYKTKRGVATASAMQVRSPVYRSSVQKWKRYESELQPMIAILEKAGLC
ncbi:MAG: hypothetical protein CL916_00825 [Deltaproteobacteria bacterium]|nr:hypothetical protein [Deltaproteobacteria bacterium]